MYYLGYIDKFYHDVLRRGKIILILHKDKQAFSRTQTTYSPLAAASADHPLHPTRLS